MAFNILKTAATLIGFEGGSQITGQRAFVMGEGTRIATAKMLVSEADGH